MAAASLTMGNCAEGVPAAVVRGATFLPVNRGMMLIQEPPSTYLRAILFNRWCRLRPGSYRLGGLMRARSYQEFWPYFMGCHEHPWTQRLHMVATVIGLFSVLVMFPLTLNGAWLIFAPAVSYPIAWFSHAVFEKKKPAAWQHPYWSFLCDVDMTAMMLMGTMDGELERLRKEPARPFTPRRKLVHHATEVVCLLAALSVLGLWLHGDISLSNPLARN